MTRSAGEVGALTSAPRMFRSWPMGRARLPFILPLRERPGPERRCLAERADDHERRQRAVRTTGESPWGCSTGCARGAAAQAAHGTTGAGAPWTAAPNAWT